MYWYLNSLYLQATSNFDLVLMNVSNGHYKSNLAHPFDFYFLTDVSTDVLM